LSDSTRRANDPPVAGVAAPRATTQVLLMAFVGILLGLLVFAGLADGIRGKELTALDGVVTPLLHDRASPALDVVMNLATFVGSDFVILPLLLVAVALLVWRGRRRDAVFLAVAVAGSIALNGTMKLFFQRPRPKLPWAHVLPDYSFPSGHSMNSLVFYVALAFLVWAIFGRRAGLAAIVGAVALAVLVGTSRIYLGYHYFTDVVGGFAAGLVWLLLVASALHVGPLLRTPRPSLPSPSPSHARPRGGG
jgi:membrane-associated phospholipid phosphatase